MREWTSAPERSTGHTLNVRSVISPCTSNKFTAKKVCSVYPQLVAIHPTLLWHVNMYYCLCEPNMSIELLYSAFLAYSAKLIHLYTVLSRTLLSFPPIPPPQAQLSSSRLWERGAPVIISGWEEAPWKLRLLRLRLIFTLLPHSFLISQVFVSVITQHFILFCISYYA